MVRTSRGAQGAAHKDGGCGRRDSRSRRGLRRGRGRNGQFATTADRHLDAGCVPARVPFRGAVRRAALGHRPCHAASPIRTCRARPPTRTTGCARGPTSCTSGTARCRTWIRPSTHDRRLLPAAEDLRERRRRAQPKDKFHFTYPTSAWEQLSQSGVSRAMARSSCSSRRRRRAGCSWRYVQPGQLAQPSTRRSANLVRGAHHPHDRWRRRRQRRRRRRASTPSTPGLSPSDRRRVAHVRGPGPGRLDHAHVHHGGGQPSPRRRCRS